VAASLIAFIVVYFLVFGAGTVYLIRLMSHAPEPHEHDIEKGTPTRAAGITPAPALRSGS
jgi:cytochrome d ubiquinol oxidase subunit I